MSDSKVGCIGDMGLGAGGVDIRISRQSKASVYTVCFFSPFKGLQMPKSWRHRFGHRVGGQMLRKAVVLLCPHGTREHGSILSDSGSPQTSDIHEGPHLHGFAISPRLA